MSVTTAPALPARRLVPATLRGGDPDVASWEGAGAAPDLGAAGLDVGDRFGHIPLPAKITVG